ncbi:hypothetical protein NDU88_002099 [Pleurodeles waltl]|uniref:Uncharacterized protein n=1 Tax=Pleurodeles waltl TaxID=8319 RepID=A0AAV7U8F8_PLEWA|nr:hypothetical protein NDU88_002099 [Pleurodeles waltl]
MLRLVRGPDGDEDADPARSRAVVAADPCMQRRGLIAIQLRMRKGPLHGTDEDRTYCLELLLNDAEHLRAEEGSGGVGRGPLSPLGSAAGPSGLR